jgi:hypothetical protein
MESQQVMEMLKILLVNQARMEAEDKAWREEMEARRNAWRKETMTCQEKTEVRLEEEPTSVEMKPEVAHEEVPLEDAEVMPGGEPRKRRWDRRHLAAQRRQKKEQKRTQRKDGCRNNLVAARRAAVAWRRINVFRKILTHGFCGLRKEVTAAGIRITRCSGHRRKGRNKGIVIEKNRIRRREPKNERKKGIKSRHVAELLHLRYRRKPAKSIGGRSRRLQQRQENYETGIAKRSAGSPFALQMIKKGTQWRGRPPPKRKKEQEVEKEPVMLCVLPG